MTFVEIHDNELLYQCISKAFAEDKKLIEKYHIKGETFEDCVLDTYHKILEVSKNETLWWYAVVDENRIVGFLIVSLAYNVLYSFGLNINERQLYGKIFFDKIKDLMGGEFGCGLWSKNTRAINYLLRNGMHIVRKENDITILKT